MCVSVCECVSSMQQIYRQSDQQFEVYTTVFSPQVCRSRRRRVEAEKVVVAVKQSELQLKQGHLIQEDEARWFVRLADGGEGFFPAACVQPLQGGVSSRDTPTPGRRGSVPVAVTTAGASCGCMSGRSTPKLLREKSVHRSLGLDGPSAAAGGSAAPPHSSPSLLHRVLAKSRRKSCPHLPHRPLDTGSVNNAFQPD